MNVLCIFAGQGYQNNQLFSFFQDNIPATTLLNQLSSVMQLDLLNATVSLKDPNYSQFLIGAYQFTLFNLLKPLLASHQINLAGYSLGEVSAFLASVQATAEEVNKVLAFRTQVMTSILSNQNSLEYDLLFIRGPFILNDIQELCTQHHCAMAIINSEERLILGGRITDLKQLLEKLPQHHLTHSQFLEIHVPSHTPFYANKKGLLQSHLNSLFYKPLLYPIFSPLQLTKIYDVKEETNLLDQELYTTLQWYKLCTLIPEYQFDIILDLGPGDAMSAQLKTMNIDLPVFTLANYNSCSAALSALGTTITCG